MVKRELNGDQMAALYKEFLLQSQFPLYTDWLWHRYAAHRIPTGYVWLTTLCFYQDHLLTDFILRHG